MRPRAMQVYRVKIVLQGVDPPIWRRVDIAGDITLRKLHGIVQAAMGWGNAHQHLFIAGQGEYGVTYPDFSSTISDERRATLAGMAAEGDRFIYVYDFGDDWNHELAIEKTFAAEPDTYYPRLIAGERACPPEDCGGPPGYARLLTALAKPQNAEHDELLARLGNNFEPEAFDPAAANAVLDRFSRLEQT